MKYVNKILSNFFCLENLMLIIHSRDSKVINRYYIRHDDLWSLEKHLIIARRERKSRG